MVGKEHQYVSSAVEVAGVEGTELEFEETPSGRGLFQTPARPKATPRLANSDSHFRTRVVVQGNPFSEQRVQRGFLVSHRTRLARHSLHPSRERVFTGPARSAAFRRGIGGDDLPWPAGQVTMRRKERLKEKRRTKEEQSRGEVGGE